MSSRNGNNVELAARSALVLTWLAVVGCGSSTKGGNVGIGGLAGARESDSGGTGAGGKGDTRAGGGTGMSGAGGSNAAGTASGSAGVRGLGGATSSGGLTGSGGITSSAGMTSAGGKAGGLGGQSGNFTGVSGMPAAAGSSGSTTVPYALVTSANGVWNSGTWTETSSDTVDVTVNDSVQGQSWEGFGGAFHELGWNLLTTPELLDEATSLLFGADGARFSIARIPIGASDYAIERYTLDDTGTDVDPTADGSSRPPADLALSGFSIARDEQTLIPYIKAALTKNPNLRFWAVAWTPPVWMKTGYKTDGTSAGLALKPSYFDGGMIKSDAATLSSYAEYMVKFVQAYQAEGIAIDAISPQDEPTFEQNYPSCTWDEPTYAKFVGQYLGPALLSANLGTQIMLGMLANYSADLDLLTTMLGDATVQPFVKSIGVEWDVLAKVETAPLTYGVPVWVTEHKCGNYPFIAAPIAATTTSPPIPAYTQPPPNDQAYGVETWWYIRDAITKAKVTAYTFPHLVLDTLGLGNDTSRQWEQNSLLVVDNGTIVPTQAYYVARHFSQFVDPGATVVTTTGGDAVAFKNPDGSLVAVVFSTAAKSDFTVAIGGKKLAFAIPAGGWATVKYTP